MVHEINELHMIFQSNIPMLYELKPRIFKHIRDFARNFMKREYVMGFSAISCREPLKSIMDDKEKNSCMFARENSMKMSI